MSNKNDFFNLQNSSDEENEQEDAEKVRLENLKKKWDWDRPENFNLYYSHKTNLKKKNLLLSSEYEENDEESNEKNSIKKHYSLVKIDQILNSSSHLYTLNGHESAVNRIYWSKTQACKSILLSSSFDGKIIVWNLSQANYKTFSNIHSKSIRNTIWSFDETEFISISYDQTSVFTSLESGKQINKFEHNDVLTAVCTHPTDSNLILLGTKNEILTWDIRNSSRKAVKIFKPKSSMGLCQDLIFINDKELVSSGDVVSKDSAEYSIIVWDFDSGAKVSNQIFHEKYICTCLKKHPFNSIFYAQTHGNYIAEFSSRHPFKMNKHKRFETNGHSTQGYSIGFDINSNGSLIASGSRDGSVYLYNSSSSKLVTKINAFEKEIYDQPCLDVKFQPLNDCINILAVSSWNGVIKVFKI